MEYQVTVDQFTGPLDLLLHLIKEHDMDLLDLDVARLYVTSISLIFKQWILHSWKLSLNI